LDTLHQGGGHAQEREHGTSGAGPGHAGEEEEGADGAGPSRAPAGGLRA
jgi:hypothetical protein